MSGSEKPDFSNAMAVGREVLHPSISCKRRPLRNRRASHWWDAKPLANGRAYHRPTDKAKLATLVVGFPTACYRDLQHFPVELFSKTPPKKECMSLFIRKEDQHSEDRLLAKAWSKDYIGRTENAASRQLVRRESAHHANKRLRKQNGQNREPY
ncbi:MAG TPA: hypothetical protein VFE60_04045 [Roseiarcus sp.]|nr:hypothetical protein [Roseiarcus sp.]